MGYHTATGSKPIQSFFGWAAARRKGRLRLFIISEVIDVPVLPVVKVSVATSIWSGLGDCLDTSPETKSDDLIASHQYAGGYKAWLWQRLRQQHKQWATKRSSPRKAIEPHSHRAHMAYQLAALPPLLRTRHWWQSLTHAQIWSNASHAKESIRFRYGFSIITHIDTYSEVMQWYIT